MLIENDEVLLENKKVVDVFNSHFQDIINLLIYLNGNMNLAVTIVTILKKIIKKFADPPSISNIKQKFKTASKFFIYTCK